MNAIQLAIERVRASGELSCNPVQDSPSPKTRRVRRATSIAAPLILLRKCEHCHKALAYNEGREVAGLLLCDDPKTCISRPSPRNPEEELEAMKIGGQMEKIQFRNMLKESA